MHTIPVLTLIVLLAAKALLRAHHGHPLHTWERVLTTIAAILTLITVVLFIVDAEGLTQ